MENPNVVIIVSVNKDYQDAAEIFLELFALNWPDCPYKILLSFSGPQFINYKDSLNFEFNKHQSLPCNIYSISKMINADYYICLLGDDFILKKIDTNEIQKLILSLYQNGIEYCNLYPQRKKSEDFYRYIHKNEVYGMSFLAFIASFDFIEREFCDNISDFEFEDKYLQFAALKGNRSKKWENRVILCTNLFHLEHGIVKGVWIPKTFYLLQKRSKKIQNSKRPKMKIYELIMFKAKGYFNRILNPKYRVIIKKILTKIGLKFSSNN